MKAKKLPFVIDAKKNWDKEIEINSENLRIWVDNDDFSCAGAKRVHRDLKKMVNILNKHWEDE